MQNASKLVSIAESISYDVDLCYGRYIVDAKSMLGVLSLPDFAYGELQIPVENEDEKRYILQKLDEAGLLYEKNKNQEESHNEQHARSKNWSSSSKQGLFSGKSFC